MWDPTRGTWRKRSLGHRERERAKAYAHEQHAKLLQGRDELRKGRVTLGFVFSLYLRYVTPTKSQGEQTADHRRAQLFSRRFRADCEPSQVTLRDWQEMMADRISGRIDHYGQVVPENERRGVRPRTVERDCAFFNAVMNWATNWRTREGSYLLPENPVRGYPVPREKNPRRAVATHDRYERTRAVSDQVMMQINWHGKRENTRSHLSEILDLANWLGRRLSSICNLTYSDLLLDHSPNGSIRFRSERDKEGYEWTVPISREARMAIDRVLQERPGIGDAPLFPSPRDPSQPVSRHACDKWLREAETLAELPKLDGKLWHAYRAKFATEMLDQPDRVVAKLGGWKAVRTLDIYQQPDEAAMLRAIESRQELREKTS